LFCLF